MSGIPTTTFHGSRVLGRGEVLDAGNECPICSSMEARTSAGSIQSDPRIELLICSICGAASASMMPTAAALESYYDSYYSSGDRAEKTTISSSERFARHIARRLDGILPSRVPRILDFGGGDGTVAMFLAKQLVATREADRVEVVVVDYTQSEPIKDGLIRKAWSRSLDELSGEFDVVLASAILEHIPELSGELRKLFDRLAPEGVFYARTPYVVPLKQILPSLDITYPGHVHDLGFPFWSRFIETFGLEATMIRSAPSIIETSIRTEPIRTLLAFFLKFPAHVEMALASPRKRRLYWSWVGGWEILLKRASR